MIIRNMSSGLQDNLRGIPYVVGRCRDCDKSFFVKENLAEVNRYCQPCGTVRDVLKSSFGDDFGDLKSSSDDSSNLKF